MGARLLLEVGGKGGSLLTPLSCGPVCDGFIGKFLEMLGIRNTIVAAMFISLQQLATWLAWWF